MPVSRGHLSAGSTYLAVRNGVLNGNRAWLWTRPKMLKNINLSRYSLCFRLLPSYIFAECVRHSFSAFDSDRNILNKLVLWGIATILTALNLGQPHLRI